jgi:galactitol-specific phosphotransferase system IIC component
MFPGDSKPADSESLNKNLGMVTATIFIGLVVGTILVVDAIGIWIKFNMAAVTAAVSA